MARDRILPGTNSASTRRLPDDLDLLLTDEPVFDLFGGRPVRLADDVVDDITGRIDALVADPRSARLTVDRHPLLRTPTPAVVADVLAITEFLCGAGGVRAGVARDIETMLVKRFVGPHSTGIQAGPLATGGGWRPPGGALLVAAGDDRGLRETALELTLDVLRALEGIDPVEPRRRALLDLYERAIGTDAWAETVAGGTARDEGGASEWTRLEELWSETATDQMIEVLPELTGPAGYLSWVLDGWVAAHERLAAAVPGGHDGRTELCWLHLQAGLTQPPAELAVGVRGELYGDLVQHLHRVGERSRTGIAEWQQHTRAWLARAIVSGQAALCRAWIDLAVRLTASLQGLPGHPVRPDPCAIPVGSVADDMRRLFRVRTVRHPLSFAPGFTVPMAPPSEGERPATRRANGTPKRGGVAPAADQATAASGAVGRGERQAAGLPGSVEPGDSAEPIDVTELVDSAEPVGVADVTDLAEMAGMADLADLAGRGGDADVAEEPDKPKVADESEVSDGSEQTDMADLGGRGAPRADVSPAAGPLPGLAAGAASAPRPSARMPATPPPTDRTPVDQPPMDRPPVGQPSVARAAATQPVRPEPASVPTSKAISTSEPTMVEPEPTAGFESVPVTDQTSPDPLASAYRLIDSIVGQPALAAALREIASAPEFAVRLLIAGPPGTGRRLSVDVVTRLLALRGFTGPPVWLGPEEFERLSPEAAVGHLRHRLAACDSERLVAIDGLDKLVAHESTGRDLAAELHRMISAYADRLQLVAFTALDGYRRLVDANAPLAAWWRVVRTRDFDAEDFATIFSRVVERRGASVTPDASRSAGELLAATPGEGQLRNGRLATYLADLAIDAAGRRASDVSRPIVDVPDLPPLRAELVTSGTAD